MYVYLYEGTVKYQDRKKKLLFKENFTIERKELIADVFDAEIIFYENSGFGKHIENKTHFYAEGSINLYVKLGNYRSLLTEVSVRLDYTQPYKKIY